MPYRHRFDAVLFDLDGTLIETAPDLTNALNHALHKAGRPPIKVSDVRPMIGDGARALLQRGLAATGPAPTEAELDRWFTDLLEYYWEHVADDSHPFPGVVELLETMRATGLKLAVCTNKPFGLSKKLFEDLDMDHLFDAVVGGDSLSVKKPDPGHILGTLEAIGVAADKAVMVGDSGNDVNAAKNAGIPVVAVSFGYTMVPAHDLGADAVIDHFRELPDALVRLA
jgi:phosphoglycolate phosphatase